MRSARQRRLDELCANASESRSLSPASIGHRPGRRQPYIALAAKRIGVAMTLKLARRGLIPPFIVMDVLRAANERAAAGADILHLEVGQPSTPAPRGVLEAARRALAGDALGYTETLGPSRAAPGDRARIIARDYGVTVDPARIVVTTGSSAGFVLAFLAAFEPGDRVALAAPGYPAYRNILTALELEPVELAGRRRPSASQPTARSAARAGDRSTA